MKKRKHAMVGVGEGRKVAAKAPFEDARAISRSARGAKGRCCPR